MTEKVDLRTNSTNFGDVDSQEMEIFENQMDDLHLKILEVEVAMTGIVEGLDRGSEGKQILVDSSMNVELVGGMVPSRTDCSS